ncbi:hypothetical protein [Bacillus pinisoli]|uniref:hypothetical protein n=1 Tax=Bacillus pinisoli TaxID=2901866 RepID=UPI001FF397D7|nr:hypothetical protein [Bacillus pinisoli]
MRRFYLLSFLVLFITACSSDVVENVERVDLIYWETEEKKSEDELINQQDVVKIFVNTVNNAKKLNEQKIIKTKPLLSFSLGIKDDKSKKYHLWITEKGEGYIQRLLPDPNGTFKIDNNSVRELEAFFEEKGNVSFISGEIDFEVND